MLFRSQENPGLDGDWIGQLVCTLTDGDITKRDAVLWGFTLKDCIPYLKHRKRQILFREAVLDFFGYKAGGEKAERGREQAVGEYCKGRDIEECRRVFGDGLPRVCATCPE